jgi:hypothetical protein
MIKINKIIPETLEHFVPNGNSLGFLNEYENLDLRVQIAEHKISGYKIKVNGILYDILPDGKFSENSNNTYNYLTYRMAALFKAQFKQYKNQ